MQLHDGGVQQAEGSARKGPTATACLAGSRNNKDARVTKAEGTKTEGGSGGMEDIRNLVATIRALAFLRG